MAEQTETLLPDGYAPADFRRNLKLYMVSFAIQALTGGFSPLGIIGVNLMLNLHAPSWMAVLPSIATTSIGYLPVVLMGWLLHPGKPKKKIYAALCFPLYGMLLVLGLSLFLRGSESFLQVMLLLLMLAFAMFIGMIVLPFWDIYYRAFPESRRGRVLGLQGSLTSIVGIVAAPLVAWMISTKAPLAFPVNYSAGMIFGCLGGWVSVVLLVMLKDLVPQPVDAATSPRRSFRRFVGDLAGIVRSDRQYVRFLSAAIVAGMISSVGVLMLVFAKKMRGVEDNHVALFIAMGPYIGIPSSALFGWLSDRIGAKRVCSIAALLMLVGIVLGPLLYGIWQVIPLTLIGFGGVIYGFVLVAILNHAPPGRNQDYLSVYYLASIIPGLVPLALVRLMDARPIVALSILGCLAVVSAVMFFVSSGSAWRKRPVENPKGDMPLSAKVVEEGAVAPASDVERP